MHGPFVSDDEVEKVVAHLKRQAKPVYLEAVTAEDEEEPEPEETPVFDDSEMGLGSGELFDQVRRREVLVPLLVVSVGSAVAALVMFFPLFGLAAVTAPSGLLLLVGCLGGGVALVLAATEASRPLLRRVLADTVVRAD